MFLGKFNTLEGVYTFMTINFFKWPVFIEISLYFNNYLQYDYWYILEYYWNGIYVISNWFTLVYFDNDRILELQEILNLPPAEHYHNV